MTKYQVIYETFYGDEVVVTVDTMEEAEKHLEELYKIDSKKFYYIKIIRS